MTGLVGLDTTGLDLVVYLILPTTTIITITTTSTNDNQSLVMGE